MGLAEDLALVLAGLQSMTQRLGYPASNAAGYSIEGSPIKESAVRDGLHCKVSVR